MASLKHDHEDLSRIYHYLTSGSTTEIAHSNSWAHICVSGRTTEAGQPLIITELYLEQIWDWEQFVVVIHTCTDLLDYNQR